MIMVLSRIGFCMTNIKLDILDMPYTNSVKEALISKYKTKSIGIEHITELKEMDEERTWFVAFNIVSSSMAGSDYVVSRLIKTKYELSVKDLIAIGKANINEYCNGIASITDINSLKGITWDEMTPIIIGYAKDKTI